VAHETGIPQHQDDRVVFPKISMLSVAFEMCSIRVRWIWPMPLTTSTANEQKPFSMSNSRA